MDVAKWHAIVVESYLTEERQRELIELAQRYPTGAIRVAIRDAVTAALTGEVIVAARKQKYD